MSKLQPDGRALAYSTFLGDRHTSTRATGGRGIAVDDQGAAYVTGYTYARSFPITRGAAQTRFKCCTDVFVTKLAPAGDALGYSTFLGGKAFSLGNGGTALALDARGDAWVTGLTFRFPTTRNARQKTPRGCCGWAFVSELDPTGRRLPYSTHLPRRQRTARQQLRASWTRRRRGCPRQRVRHRCHVRTPVPDDSAHRAAAVRGRAEACGPPGRDAFVTKLSPDGRRD